MLFMTRHLENHFSGCLVLAAAPALLSCLLVMS